jgi:ABC-type Fe3+/spermidine/putrescine transport system ATPase subunit
VTHDQAEAMVISDRIIVMNHGRIEQQGDARTIYGRPANRFVAQFIGLANLLPGRVAAVDGLDGSLLVDVTLGPSRPATLRATPSGAGLSAGARVLAMIRPEDVEVGPAGTGSRGNGLEGTVVGAVYMGSHVDYQVDVAGVRIRAEARAGAPYREGDRVALGVPPAGCLCIPDDDGDAPERAER